MLGLTLPGLPWLTPAAALAVPVYTLLALRRVYGGRRWPLLLRAATLCLLYFVGLMVTIGALGLWAFLA
jgi:hypothetical protein